MKKTALLILSLFSLSCLAACGGNVSSETKSEESQPAASSKEEGASLVSSEESKQPASSEQEISVSVNKDFTGITFNDASFVYDGTVKSIYVVGAPDFAAVTYDGNDQINSGTYTVKAHITAEGYNALNLSATLTISKATFEDVVFENQTFEYDGKPHSIYVTGVPEEATVAYTNNGKIKVGTYTVTAEISSPNYNTLTKTATLTIAGRTITGVTFEDQTVEYDGKSHSILVSGDLPEGVAVAYTNNGKTDAGTYTVTAKLTGEGYEPLELKAKLIITPAELKDPGNFSDQCFPYDGKNHSLVVTYAPSYSTVTYKCTNASGTNTFKNPGQYNIEATVKMDNNCMSVLKATMFIIEEGSIGVDSSKSALTIDENLKWDELHEALSRGNYTYDYYDGSYPVEGPEDLPPEGLLDESYSTHELRMRFATDGKQAYGQKYSTYDEDDPYYAYEYYKQVGDDIVHTYFHDDGSYTEVEKFPKDAFGETVSQSGAASALVALTRGENGEIKSGVDRDDYYKDAGYPIIEDGKFIVLRQHYRSTSHYGNYFVYQIYVFYNIGNTTVTLPSSSAPSQNYVDHCAFAAYRLGGVRYRRASYGPYNHMVTYYSAEVYVSYTTRVFLKPGTYTVLPYIYDEPVMAIVHYSYYNQYYCYDQSGYAFNLYVNEDGEYQGEYAELGTLGRLSLRDFTSDDGTINYYDDWHD